MIALLLTLSAMAADCTVFHGDDATFVLPEGRRSGMALVVADGEIAALDALPGLGVTLGDGTAAWRDRTCDAVDVSGKWVSPGLVAFGSHIGAVEVSAVPLTNDLDADGDLNAAVRIGDAYDPRSTVIPVNRIRGVTSSVVFPTGGFVSGQAAFVSLAGDSQADTVIDRGSAMVVHLAGGSRAGALLRLRTLLDDAAYFRSHRRDYDAGNIRPLSASRTDLEALEPVLLGAMPLVVFVDQAVDIEAVLDLLGEFEAVKPVLVGGAEAWLLADRLAAAEVPVAVAPWIYGPGSFDQVHARPDNAKLLHEAGVKVVLLGDGAHWSHTLSQYAGNAVRGGLDWDAAMAGITRIPAEVVGLTDIGLLAVGARANLVVWSGDPLELSSSVLGVMIEGADVPLESRQTHLMEKYRTLPGTPPPPLP